MIWIRESRRGGYVRRRRFTFAHLVALFYSVALVWGSVSVAGAALKHEAGMNRLTVEDARSSKDSRPFLTRCGSRIQLFIIWRSK